MAPVSCSRDETAGDTANQTLSEEASIPTCREHDWLLMSWQFNSSTAVLPRGTEDDSLSTHRYLLVPCNGSLIRYATPIPLPPLSPYVLLSHKARKFVSQGIAVSCNIRIGKRVLDILMDSLVVRLFRCQGFKSMKITYLKIFTISEYHSDPTNMRKGGHT